MEVQPITVNDLTALKDIIDLACSRGAFRGGEMEAVGALYNKLSNFLLTTMMQAETTQQGD